MAIWTPYMDKLLATYWLQGRIAKSISEELKCSTETIYKHCKRLNLPRRKSSKRSFVKMFIMLPPEEYAAIRRRAASAGFTASAYVRLLLDNSSEPVSLKERRAA